MLVKELCDVLVNSAEIHVYKEDDYKMWEIPEPFTTNELRWSKYRDREVLKIRTFSVGLKDDFCIRVRNEL